MRIKHHPFYSILTQLFVALVSLFLCSTPVFYFIVSLGATERYAPYIYMAARTLRLLAAVVLSLAIHKRNQKIFVHNDLLRKKFVHFTLGYICLSIWLHFGNVTPTLYSTISHTIGIYNLETTPLFLAVLWEQLFAGDLYWSILLGLLIVFYMPTSRKTQDT